MKKRLIFVTKALWIGGIETALVTLLNYLDYEKYDVTLLVYRAELNMADRITSRCRLLIADRDKTYSFGIPYRFKKLYHLTEETGHPSRLHRAMMWTVPAIKWVENRLYIRYIRDMMKGETFDTCVIYSDVAAETAIRAIKADKFLMFYHHGAMRHVYHDEIGYRKSQEIIAVSHSLAQNLKSFIPKYAEKIICVPNLTDAKTICQKSEEQISTIFLPDIFHIVTVGRISAEKGMDLAVSACRKLVDQGYTNLHWWIVGGGPAFHELEKQISSLELDAYISLVGMQENPYPFIRKADLYVQPSRVESFGLTIKEALVLGKTIVSTDTDGARETMAGRNCGRLCPISDLGLAELVRFYLEHPDQANTAANFCDTMAEENEESLKMLNRYL